MVFYVEGKKYLGYELWVQGVGSQAAMVTRCLYTIDTDIL